MADDTLIRNVSDTAFWVAYYRAKESTRSDALFRDPLAERLVGEHGRRIADSMPQMGRYTEWAVVSRTILIDRLILRFIAEGGDAVINLGAGLDTRPYRMELPASLEWIEADQSTVIDHKTALLASETPRCRLSRVSVDLADAVRRRAFLEGAAPGARKVLVLTEGVIPYLSAGQVSELAADLLAQTRISYWITEYFHPRVYPHLQKAVRRMAMRHAPFQFYPEDWLGFFRNVGWVAKETRYSGEVAREFKRRPPMPKWLGLLSPLLPRKVKERIERTTGYLLLERASTVGERS